MTSHPFPDRAQMHMINATCIPPSRELVGDDRDGESHPKALQLPIELWIEVFELLDLRVLSRIALTCKVFHRFSTPLLDRELSLTLPREEYTWNLNVPEKASVLSVRSIIVEASALPSLLTLVVSLPRFLNLRSLTFRHASLTRFQLESLQRMLPPHSESLPCLASLTLIDCNSDAFNHDWPSLPLSHIHVEHLCAMDQVWCPLLSPAHLTRLSVPMRMTSGELPALPHLRHLHLYGSAKLGPRWEQFLSSGKCPDLETFEMEPYTSDKGYTVAVTPCKRFDLQRLRSYRGPDVYAPMFAWTASLVHASLWRAPKNDMKITKILSQLCQFAPALKSLHLCTLRIGTPTIDATGGFCALEELMIHLKTKHLIRKVTIVL
jgi:hypothetical protein